MSRRAPKFLGPINVAARQWAPGLSADNPYDRVHQAASWEMFDRSNRYYEQAAAEHALHPQYALALQASAGELRAAAVYTAKLTARRVARDATGQPDVGAVRQKPPAPRARRQRRSV
jgi:hypothetical protein